MEGKREEREDEGEGVDRRGEERKDVGKRGEG